MSTSGNIINLVDGDNLYYRVYSQFQNFPNGPLYGFIQSLHKLIKNYPANYMVVAWGDRRSNLWRRVDLPTYKENRDKLPPLGPEFHSQREIVIKLLNNMGLLSLKLPSFEADDIIAEICYQCYQIKPFEHIIYVFSNDKDFLQLVVDQEANYGFIRCIQYSKDKTHGFIEYDKAAVVAKYGITPEQFPIYLAIAGDRSDNIKGIYGYGEKTVSALLNNFSIDEIFSGRLRPVKWLNGNKIKSLNDNINQVRFNLKLVNLRVPVIHPPIDITNLPGVNVNLSIIQEILTQLNLIQHLPKVQTIINTLYQR